MNETKTPHFVPAPPDAFGMVSWIHLGDAHMVRAAGENQRDLMALVEEINGNFAGKGISFVSCRATLRMTAAQKRIAVSESAWTDC